MKSFTAKEFSRCPAKVYEAAREDGKVEVTHDRFRGKFLIEHKDEIDPVILCTIADMDAYNKGLIDINELKRRESKIKKATN